MEKVLVVNAGSSTIKWKLFDMPQLTVVAEGMADRLFIGGTIETKFNGEKHTRDVKLDSHSDASREIYKDFLKLEILKDVSEIKNIGFRIVQGGNIFLDTALLEEEEIKQVADLKKLAPLHNGAAVQAINAFKEIFKDAKLTGTFDTAFHSTIPKINSTYPIESKLAEKYGIKKYGAHGTSHKFITQKLEEVLNKKSVSFLSMHIGSGASLCAVKDSKSFDTSMGLTPLAGIMMGTRSGDIDPSIHAYVCKEENISIEQFEEILNKKSGLLGVSGVSNDMRDVLIASSEGNKQATFAVELFVQKIIDYTANYINKLGSVDAIVFTAGVGENASIIRKKIIEKINVLNIELDSSKNEGKIGDVTLISSNNSQTPVYVIRTDEEYMIAKESILLTN